MGVEKSTVWTSASAGVSRYTPASSAVSKPMSTLGSCCRANFPSTESSTAGLSLLAQPAAFTISVRRVVLTSDMQVHSSGAAGHWHFAVITWQLAISTWHLASGVVITSEARNLL